MARVKIELPDSFQFSTVLKVRISDINYGGHLGNDSVVSLVHEARYQFYKSLGYKDELSFDGIGTIQADLAVAYRSEAFHGDEIEIKIAVAEVSRFSFDLIYLLQTPDGEREIARAKTLIVTYDYEQKKKVNIPQSLLEKISK